MLELLGPWCKAQLRRLGIADSVFGIVEMLLEDSHAPRFEHPRFFRKLIQLGRNKSHQHKKKKGHEAEKESKLVLQAITDQLIIVRYILHYFQKSFYLHAWVRKKCMHEIYYG